MITSQIQATLPYNIKIVWQAVTDIKNYHWRSDLSHTEVLNKYQFTKYAKNGTPTHFTTTVFQPYSCWEFTLEKQQHQRPLARKFFLNRELLPLYTLPKKLPLKKFCLKPILKFYLRRQQKLL